MDQTVTWRDLELLFTTDEEADAIMTVHLQSDNSIVYTSHHNGYRTSWSISTGGSLTELTAYYYTLTLTDLYGNSTTTSPTSFTTPAQPPVLPLADLSDAFDGPNLDTSLWGLFYGQPLPAFSSGNIVFAKVSGSNAFIDGQNYWGLVGSFTILDITALPNPSVISSGSLIGYLEIYSDDSQGYVEVDFGGNSSGNWVEAYSNGPGDSFQSSWDPVAQRFWQVAEDSGTITVSYGATNAGPWTSFYSVATTDAFAATDELVVELGVYGGGTGTGSWQVNQIGIPTGPHAPIITNISATPSSTSAVITWTTDEAADSHVLWGLASDLSDATDTGNSTALTSHSVSISGLAPLTHYYYRVQSTASSLTSQSSIRSFTTLALPLEIGPVTAVDIGPMGFGVMFSTNQPALCTLHYGYSPSYGENIVEEEPAERHFLSIVDRQTGSTTFYRVSCVAANAPDRIVDSSGNVVVSQASQTVVR
jgi:Purple acid Phosphatase, N-terminal domain